VNCHDKSLCYNLEVFDSKSKILFISAVIIFLCAGLWRYYEYFVAQDFMISSRINCDPSISSCFVSTCDPGDSECSTDPYLKIIKKANKIEECTFGDEKCSSMSCENGEKDCSIISCNINNVMTGEHCSDGLDMVGSEEVKK